LNWVEQRGDVTTLLRYHERLAERNVAQKFPPILKENVGGELEDVIVVVVVHTNVQDNVLPLHERGQARKCLAPG